MLIGSRWPATLSRAITQHTAHEAAVRKPKIVKPTRIVAADLSDDLALGAATIVLFNSVTSTTDVIMKMKRRSELGEPKPGEH